MLFGIQLKQKYPKIVILNFSGHALTPVRIEKKSNLTYLKLATFELYDIFFSVVIVSTLLLIPANYNNLR